MLPADAAEEMAEEVGLQYGRTMATAMGSPDASGAVHKSFRTAFHAVADALTAHGFAAHAERPGDSLRIVSDHFPFGGAAIEHPVTCAVDRGLVLGMLGALYGASETSSLSSRPSAADRRPTATPDRPPPAPALSPT